MQKYVYIVECVTPFKMINLEITERNLIFVGSNMKHAEIIKAKMLKAGVHEKTKVLIRKVPINEFIIGG